MYLRQKNILFIKLIIYNKIDNNLKGKDSFCYCFNYYDTILIQ